MSTTPPSREDVTTRWLGVARGEFSQESVSAWAEPFMFASFETTPDVMVMQALQYLHGFDLTYRSADKRLAGHGPPGTYLRTLDEVHAEFEAWRERCEAYDADPEGWLAARRREAEDYVRRERDRK